MLRSALHQYLLNFFFKGSPLTSLEIDRVSKSTWVSFLIFLLNIHEDMHTGKVSASFGNSR